MPTFRLQTPDSRLQLILKTCFLLVSGLYILASFAPPARANTDPKSATPSATATVPTTTPTTSDTTSPTIPILIRPTDGTVTSDPAPEFVWHYSTDDNSNTVFYTLYLNNVATFLGIADTGNSRGAGYTARIEAGDIRLLPLSPLPDGSYSWYVTASDLSGNTSHSATWHLTIDTSPPPLTLVDLDSLHNPTITNGANFDIAGPKDIYFTIQSDPFVEIQITLTSLESIVYRLSSNTSPTGLASLYQHLTPGQYTVSIVAIDHAGNTSILPDFTLTITQAQLLLPAIPGLTSTYSIPYNPYTIPSLPATISQLSTSYRLASIIYILLAISIVILLVFLWFRRYNLILLDSQFRPIKDATIYHSLPPLKSGVYHLTSSDQGRLFIPHLTRYSTLTIRLQSQDICTTYILSICAKRRVYTLVLG